jgi:dienelactone hydrolase
MRVTWWWTAALLALSIAAPASAAPIEAGAGAQTATIDGTALELFTYRPAGCVPTGFLIVFHGVGRNADGYRDHARPLADRLCLIAVAPLFDKERFPSWRYQMGGVVYRHAVQDPAAWTGTLVPKLVEWLRRENQTPMLPYTLIGHSAGGQFLSRLAAYVPNQAQRMVITNPSTHVLASLSIQAPYGFGGLAGGEDLLKRYLAAPITLLLGEEDQGEEHLDESPEAEAQGATRFERGERAFHQAQATAQQHGWAFNWRLVEVPGVGHNAKSMFASPQAVEALRPS